MPHSPTKREDIQRYPKGANHGHRGIATRKKGYTTMSTEISTGENERRRAAILTTGFHRLLDNFTVPKDRILSGPGFPRVSPPPKPHLLKHPRPMPEIIEAGEECCAQSSRRSSRTDIPNALILYKALQLRFNGNACDHRSTARHNRVYLRRIDASPEARRHKNKVDMTSAHRRAKLTLFDPGLKRDLRKLLREALSSDIFKAVSPNNK
jgi:hypothetical protein